MAGKRAFLLAGMLALCFSPAFVQALTVTQGGLMQGQRFFIDREGEEARFIQRLIWEESMYALRYLVIVQRLEDDGYYREAERASVYENFIDVSLYAGSYRFRVEVFDLVDEFAFSTDWQYFEILRALQPELSGFSPDRFLLDADEVWELTLHGENLLPGSVFYLVRGDIRIMPRRHTSDGTSALLVFEMGSLIPGEYYVYVRNPGGLDTRLGTFAIAFQRPFDLNISLGFAPLVPLYGFLFNDFTLNNFTVDAPFPDSFYALGAVTRISFIPFKRVWGYLGLELSSSLTILEHERAYFTANTFFLNAHLGLLYQRYFFERNFAFNLTLGAGVTSLMNFHYTYPVGPQTESKTAHYISAIAGLSVKAFFFSPFFISAGVDFIHVFSPEQPMPGVIRPFVAAGVRL